MSEPFLAEVKIVGFNFAPRGFAFCDGQILPINQNQSLFSLLGTTYGGDGRTTFALPDLRGRAPMHVGTSDFNLNLGQRSGEENVSLGVNQTPQHTHVAQGTSEVAGTTNATGALLAQGGGGRRPLIPYGDLSAPVAMISASVKDSGSGQSHDNMQPYLTLGFVIALQGLFPSRN